MCEQWSSIWEKDSGPAGEDVSAVGGISQPISKVMRFSSMSLRKHSQNGETRWLPMIWNVDHRCGGSSQGEKSETEMRTWYVHDESWLCAELNNARREWGQAGTMRKGLQSEEGDWVGVGRQRQKNIRNVQGKE